MNKAYYKAIIHCESIKPSVITGMGKLEEKINEQIKQGMTPVSMEQVDDLFVCVLLV